MEVIIGVPDAAHEVPRKDNAHYSHTECKKELNHDNDQQSGVCEGCRALYYIIPNAMSGTYII